MKKPYVLLLLIVLGTLSLIFFRKGKPNLNAKLEPEELYLKHCQACHLLPQIDHIEKKIWEGTVLPEMGARVGIYAEGFNPYRYTMEENYQIRLSGVYPDLPTIDSTEWQRISDYILSQAPDSIPLQLPEKIPNQKLNQFKPSMETIGTGITLLKFEPESHQLFIGDANGKLYEPKTTSASATFQFSSPVISTVKGKDAVFITEVGILNPSEISRGVIYRINNGKKEKVFDQLHRPVFTLMDDLDENGTEEIIVCEFGNHTGQLSLLVRDGEKYQKKTLLALPGSIRVEIADMNSDGKKDIVALFAQAREGIYIFYQKNDLDFEVVPSIQFGPEYGSSWFELLDYNNDGYQDIVLANGDNADYSIFLKPYHGIRLFINNGKNEFTEDWFYPIYGATRVLADDFDLDGDTDFAVLSFFPDLENGQEESFVYLENKVATDYDFEPFVTQTVLGQKWLVMEKGDFDNDGDVDLVLGSLFSVAPNSDGNILHLQNLANN